MAMTGRANPWRSIAASSRTSGSSFDEQVSEGDRVATGWTLYGTNRGRTVKLTGHTISRFADGLVVEDHGSTDTIELLRQLGAWRSLVMLATEWRFLLRGSGKRERTVGTGNDLAARWQRTYAEKPIEKLSWTEAVPATSLDLIAEADRPATLR